MSIVVNLLPREVAVRRLERRTATVTSALVLVFAVALGGLYALKLGQVADAEAERDIVQGQVSQLEAEVASLEQYRQLADELEARNAVLASAMSGEVSHARILNDLSLSFPSTSSLRSLQIASVAAEAGAASTGASVDDQTALLTYQGYSTERFAPGVEAVLIEFDKVRSFFNTFVDSAAVEEIGDTEVTAFSGTVGLDDEAYTHRYADGLPEEVNQ